MSLAQLPMQQKTDTVDVHGDNGKSDRAGEALSTLCPNAVKTAMLKIIDRRLNRRMLAAHRGKHFATLALLLRLVEIALFRQNIVIKQRIQKDPVVGTVETTVKAYCTEVRKPRLRRLYHRHRVIDITAFPHDLMMKHEAVRVFQNADRTPKFHRTPRLTLRYPTRVRLEDREHLLPLGIVYPLSRQWH